ncbi:MAG: PAS domain-containing protein [Candidatus Omnitrophica bacterium]|nr:PAS domain-containing protein [Candidatus Omnitrophota bacterium]MCB9719944.1 PAS domain-containing protein [Candidatus Omnitrophota bacterium]
MGYKEKMSELANADAFEYTERIINTVHEPLIILYGDLKVALANRAFYRIFEVVPEETEERYVYELGNGQWDIPKLRHLLEEIIPKEKSFDGFEVEHAFPGIGNRTMLLNACRFVMEANRTKLIIITFKDITDHKMIDRLRKRVEELEKRLNHLTITLN